jgi:hypothetical protein
MEHIEITKASQGLQIEGFPNAVKVLRLRLNEPKARRLADLNLHKVDLEFALGCLEQINNSVQPFIRQVLWRSAVVHYMKCFGKSSSRFSLISKKVYQSDMDAIEAYSYFHSLRNKHLVHDENSYAQCLIGAVLNKKDIDHKIAKIVCLSLISETLTQENYNNLHLLISQAQTWVLEQSDLICDQLTADLEPQPYETLFAIENMTYSAPTGHDIHNSRH